MGWADVPLGDLLQERLPWPVTLENDVHALTVGEHWFGVGLGTASFAIVTIGRGIGSGLHLNGEVVTGAYGVAGEIGHLPLADPPLSARAAAAAASRPPPRPGAIEAAVSAAHGRPIAIDEAVALAHAGDPAADAAFREAATIIGTAIATLVNLTGPEVVIIGGEGVSNFDLFDEDAARRLRRARVRRRRALPHPDAPAHLRGLGAGRSRRRDPVARALTAALALDGRERMPSASAPFAAQPPATADAESRETDDPSRASSSSIRARRTAACCSSR